MEVKYAFVCQAANISQTGNLNVLGIFDHINTNKLPFQGSLTYVANISAHRSEVGEHNFTLGFVNDDGKSLLPPLKGKINFTAEKQNNSIMLNAQLSFPEAGVYHIDLTVDNMHIRTDSIVISLINQGQLPIQGA